MNTDYRNFQSELLTVEQMQAADQFAINQGITGLFLMERAGQHISNSVEKLLEGPTHIHVIAGKGNNGGDAFVAARLLKQRGYQLTVDLIGKCEALKGDAKVNAERWCKLSEIHEEGVNFKNAKRAALIIDGIIGAGLKKDLSKHLNEIITHINDLRKPIIAIDIPTGINGNTGQAAGCYVRANKTVSFFRAKPGHFLHPGKEATGELIIKDIAIPKRALKTINVTYWKNQPSLWQSSLPALKQTVHKYQKGAVLIACTKGAMAGASSLAANAAIRAGAGLATIAKPESMPHPARCFAAIMTVNINLTETNEEKLWSKLIKERKIQALLLGPGLPANKETKTVLKAVASTPPALCLDAGALTAFEEDPDELLEILAKRRAGQTVLTPHEGEFKRLNAGKTTKDKLSAARELAKKGHSIVVLKGPETIIAAPDGRVIINTNAPSKLATAGTGDVLAGIITAYLARNIPAFEAAAAAVATHSEAASLQNFDIISDDLIEKIPEARARLKL